MFNDDKYSSIALVVLIGIFVQLILGFGDRRETPHRAVVEFAKAYYRLNPSMAERVCNELRMIDEVDMVNKYILIASSEAKTRGFDPKALRAKLYHIETETIKKGDASAEVHFTATKMSGINPVYAYVGKLFGFTKPEKIEKKYAVIKENGKWKVCGNLFSNLES